MDEKENARREYHRAYYLKNKEKILARTNAYYHANKDRYRDLDRERYRRDRNKRIARVASANKKIREWYSVLKSELQCERCGFKHPAALDFHHRDPRTKEHNIGSMIRGTWSRKRILEEIEKCDVLCSNCHRVEHSM